MRKPLGKWRIGSDPNPLNTATKGSPYPLPATEDIHLHLTEAKVFNICDTQNGLWHTELDEPSSPLASFATPTSWHLWVQIPMGVCLAPEVF